MTEAVTVTVPKDEWDSLVSKVSALTEVVQNFNDLFKALADNPMFAGFMPPALQRQLSRAGE